MPRAAFWLKENLGGTFAGASSTAASEDEDAVPSLGHSEISAVQHPVGPPIPEVFQRVEYAGEVLAFVGTKEPWNILNEAPAGAEFFGEASEFKEEAGAFGLEPSALSGDGDILAREAACEEVNTARGMASRVGA